MPPSPRRLRSRIAGTWAAYRPARSARTPAGAPRPSTGPREPPSTARRGPRRRRRRPGRVGETRSSRASAANAAHHDATSAASSSPATRAYPATPCSGASAPSRWSRSRTATRGRRPAATTPVADASGPVAAATGPIAVTCGPTASGTRSETTRGCGGVRTATADGPVPSSHQARTGGKSPNAEGPRRRSVSTIPAGTVSSTRRAASSGATAPTNTEGSVVTCHAIDRS